MSDDAFRLTPLDLRKQEFRKAMRGFDPAEVDDFRARAADELERVVRERLALEEKVKRQEEQLLAFREREKAMNDALVAAQQLRAETREQAEREAQMIIREAEAEGERRLERARREIERLEATTQNLGRQHHAYLAALRSLVERQKAELDAMADAQPSPYGKVAGAIQPAEAAEAERAREARKSSPKWIKNIVEE
ncbi:MAG TPA: DivIVA domain-containing protein [Gemmatimonadales bacterium]|nr:DivIVA domain-containing protein [Gemmatimonadales bacterium]